MDSLHFHNVWDFQLLQREGTDEQGDTSVQNDTTEQNDTAEHSDPLKHGTELDVSRLKDPVTKPRRQRRSARSRNSFQVCAREDQ